MIEVNLLPGAKKKARRGGGGPSLKIGPMIAGIVAKVKDPWLIAAVVTPIIMLIAVGFLFTTQRARASTLGAEEKKATDDSAHYASVMEDQRRAIAKRDSAQVQVAIIKSIDEDRLIWPHILDEVSRNLPEYTWITLLQVTGTPQGQFVPSAKALMPPEEMGKTKKKTPSKPLELPKDTVRVRIMGRTVDIQALTRFMTRLEDSPFLGNVVFQKSELATDAGKELVQFVIDVTYTPPDSTHVRRVALTVPPIGTPLTPPAPGSK